MKDGAQMQTRLRTGPSVTNIRSHHVLSMARGSDRSSFQIQKENAMKKLIVFVLMSMASVAHAGMCDIVLVDVENAATLAVACVQDVEYAKNKKTAIKSSENCRKFRKKRIAVSKKIQKNQKEFESCARLFEHRFSNFAFAYELYDRLAMQYGE